MVKLLFVILIMFLCFLPAIAAEWTPKELEGYKVHKLWRFNESASNWRPDNNVGPFTIKNGILSFTNTGFDPWIINTDLGDVDAGACSFIGIKMRSSAAGSTQVYFATDSTPIGEKNVAACSTLGNRKFHVCEVELGRLPTWKGKITQLRIDPVNGSGEQGAEIGIEWIALYQIPARIVVGRPFLNGKRLTLPISNTGGEAASDLLAQAGGINKRVESLEAGKTVDMSFDLADTSAPIEITAGCGGKPVFNVELQPRKHAGVTRIANDLARLTFDDATHPSSVELAVMTDGKARPVGIFHPLGTLAYRDDAGVLQYIELGADSVSINGASAVLDAARTINGMEARFKWVFKLPNGNLDGCITYNLTCDAPIDILRFEGSRLLAGEGSFGAAKRHALFPGLEYLESGENSSSPSYVGPKHADRRIPHPYKVTVPVMAVESDGLLVGLSWDPNAKWAAGEKYISAQFESPNQSVGAENHLMSLFAPSIPNYARENRELAERPYRLPAGKSITVSCNFFARPGKIDDVVPNYFTAHGIPKPPPIAHGYKGTIDVSLKAYTDSLYSPKDNGWKPIVGFPGDYGPRGDFAARILAESLNRNDFSLARKCRIDPSSQLAQRLGNSLDWFSDGARKPIEDLIATQSADGGFPYTISEEKQKEVKTLAASIDFDCSTLGKVGSTNSGLIGTAVNQILIHAVRTGDRKMAGAGLRGLAMLNNFTVPRGAQTWEVPADTPDIYGAALAVDCNVYAYHLTGDEHYLTMAHFWARTGLPFIYSWRPPANIDITHVLHYDEKGWGKNPVISDATEFYENLHRLVNPGATIPVFGTSFYIVKWFGLPVQWCGLAWANSTLRYLKLRPDPVLKNAAKMVFASATQQQVERGFIAGTFTDVWGVEPEMNAPVFIEPASIMDCAYELLGEKSPLAIEVRGFDFRGERACFNTFAQIADWSWNGGRLEATLKYYPGQDVYTCIAPINDVGKIEVDGRKLYRARDLTKSPSGYYFDKENKALHIKFRPNKDVTKLMIVWDI